MAAPLLIPRPREITIDERDRCYVLHSDQKIVISNPAAEYFAAKRLQTALRTEAGLNLEIVIGRGNSVQHAINLKKGAGLQQSQSYILAVAEKEINVYAQTATGIFYGVCTLIQLIRQFGAQIPWMTIKDYPDFLVRGVMLDVSRCKVPTMETLYQLIDFLAGLKINQIQLYTEHTFAYSEHPTVWALASPLTGEEILELDAFCKERHIDLVPNQNSFGHLEHWLTDPRYRHLAECPGGYEYPWGDSSEKPFSLCPTHPQSIRLLGDLYTELLAFFSSGLFNVGCDETWDLGQGQSHDACEQRGRHRVYLDFLLEIYKLVKRHRRRMMFWGDIILQAPELIAKLPKDIIALVWGYEKDHPFAEQCEKFAQSGIDFYVCPGTSAWNSIGGRSDNAIGNLKSAAINGLKHGAKGYLITDWGDNGHWQYLPISFLGYAYGAGAAWCQKAVDEKDFLAFNNALSLQCFHDPTGMMGQVAYGLGNIYKIYEQNIAGTPNNSFLAQFLYQEIGATHGSIDWSRLTPDFLAEVKKEIQKAIRYLSGARMQREDAVLIKAEFESAARLMLHACRLAEFKLIQSQIIDISSSDQIRREALDLAADLQGFLAEHQKLWLARNRIGGFEEGSGSYFREMIKSYERIAAEYS